MTKQSIERRKRIRMMRRSVLEQRAILGACKAREAFYELACRCNELTRQAIDQMDGLRGRQRVRP